VRIYRTTRSCTGQRQGLSGRVGTGRLHRAAVGDSVVMEEAEIPSRYRQPEFALLVPASVRRAHPVLTVVIIT